MHWCRPFVNGNNQFFFLAVTTMAESLTSELQTQLTNLWKNKNIPTWNGGYHSYSDKQIQTSIDSKYIYFILL